MKLAELVGIDDPATMVQEMYPDKTSAKGGPARTAITPDLARGCPSIAAISPAAKMSGWEIDCSRSDTRKKPRASAASPASACQDGLVAWVAIRISSRAAAGAPSK